MQYHHSTIEKKWQEMWERIQLYRTVEKSRQQKLYVLDMFPYPSGEGLHVGHTKGYIATDVIARRHIMAGKAVLHPMGWDAFGLPAENHALKHKIHPALAVNENIARFKKQLLQLGFTYDWNREINTTDPDYYRWTQWIFVQLFKKGLAYESFAPINWCPSCKTGLANEDVENGRCERCGSLVEKKPMRQWILRITDYAERLLDDLQDLQWPESIKEAQRQWIGKSEGAEIDFLINNSAETITVFTTRLDTIYGVTYVVVAPEYPLLQNWLEKISNREEVERYIEAVKNKPEIERTATGKEKSGVVLQGIQVVHPLTKELLPVWVADYVLGDYGTGAVMAVPAHDERDYAFAQKYELPVKEVITADGILCNSEEFSDLTSEVAREKIIKAKHARKVIRYKLRDWVFSRQRYWGEPIPIIHCETCGAVAVPESDLPVRLPEVESYEPTGTGESPLAGISEWVTTTCPSCGGPGKRETNTMPQWAGSSWYYLRYIDPHNDEVLVDKKKEAYWSPVDIYVGGAEHSARHLIYARFWHKFLYDIKVVSEIEPFKQYINVGLVLDKDGRKMSKRWGNVVNPDELVAEYGADAFRLYEMFIGPFNQTGSFNVQGVAGSESFLRRIWQLQEKVREEEVSKELVILTHKTIKKVTEDIDSLRFNTAISSLMILANAYSDAKSISPDLYETLLKLLAPFAPHICEELWHRHERPETESIFQSDWPSFDSKQILDEVVTIVVQVNGKLRDSFDIEVDASEDVIKAEALIRPKVQQWIEGKDIERVVVVKGKIINIVVKS